MSRAFEGVVIMFLTVYVTYLSSYLFILSGKYDNDKIAKEFSEAAASFLDQTVKALREN